MSATTTTPSVPRERVTCEVCARTAYGRTHPCRFARACSCWRDIPCNPKERSR